MSIFTRLMIWLFPDCYNYVVCSDPKSSGCGEGYKHCNRFCKHLERTDGSDPDLD
jgi:hypothetical protein